MHNHCFSSRRIIRSVLSLKSQYNVAEYDHRACVHSLIFINHTYLFPYDCRLYILAVACCFSPVPSWPFSVLMPFSPLDHVFFFFSPRVFWGRHFNWKWLLPLLNTPCKQRSQGHLWEGPTLTRFTSVDWTWTSRFLFVVCCQHVSSRLAFEIHSWIRLCSACGSHLWQRRGWL